MRLLHFSSAMTWRGGEQQIIYLQEELVKYGIEQWIFCPVDSALAKFCLQRAIPFFTYRKRFAVNPLVAVQLKKYCQRLAIDLVHIHDAHSHTFSYISALLGNKCPFVLSRRVDFPVRKNYFSHLKYNHPSIKKILCVSHYVEKILAPSILDKHKIAVVHSGIDLSRLLNNKSSSLRAEYNIPEYIKVIANIAAIASHKDYFTFVDTAEILLNMREDILFFIVGADGGDREEIIAYINEKNLDSNIVLTGFRSDIPQILSAIDIFLFTSKEEGLGTSIIDAFASGIPVVATEAGGIPEIVQNGRNGLLAPIGDAQALAHAVHKVLSDSQLVKQIVVNAKHTAMSFSKQLTAQKTYNLYKEILQ